MVQRRNILGNQILFIGIIFGVLLVLKRWMFKKKRERRCNNCRNESSSRMTGGESAKLCSNLTPDVVYTVAYLQPRSTTKKRRNIKKEPIEWLVSCTSHVMSLVIIEEAQQYPIPQDNIYHFT